MGFSMLFPPRALPDAASRSPSSKAPRSGELRLTCKDACLHLQHSRACLELVQDKKSTFHTMIGAGRWLETHAQERKERNATSWKVPSPLRLEDRK